MNLFYLSTHHVLACIFVFYVAIAPSQAVPTQSGSTLSLISPGHDGKQDLSIIWIHAPKQQPNRRLHSLVLSTRSSLEKAPTQFQNENNNFGISPRVMNSSFTSIMLQTVVAIYDPTGEVAQEHLEFWKIALAAGTKHYSDSLHGAADRVEVSYGRMKLILEGKSKGSITLTVLTKFALFWLNLLKSGLVAWWRGLAYVIFENPQVGAAAVGIFVYFGLGRPGQQQLIDTIG